MPSPPAYRKRLRCEKLYKGFATNKRVIQSWQCAPVLLSCKLVLLMPRHGANTLTPLIQNNRTKKAAWIAASEKLSSQAPHLLHVTDRQHLEYSRTAAKEKTNRRSIPTSPRAHFS
eukprot:1138789-Pelagomonas_calceolata.AAC.4